ncbi:MAG: hypothetical protein NC321_01105 [Clostridium sp.]|nr:hypothetical protein [Clostridium sp.]
MKNAKVLVSILCAAILFNMGGFTSQAKPISNSNITSSIEISFLSSESVTANSNIEPFSAKTQWIYKTINGITYRRLYDLRNQCWIGDWEIVP